MTCDIWHMTCDTWHVTCCGGWNLRKFQLHSFYGLLKFGNFWGRGGVPDSKTFEELFCLHLDIFQKFPKMMRDIFCFDLVFFKYKIWGDNQSLNTFGNFSSYKIRFKKKFLKRFQTTAGGSRPNWRKNKQIETDFLLGWLPLMNQSVTKVFVEQPVYTGSVNYLLQTERFMYIHKFETNKWTMFLETEAVFPDCNC